jgi:protein-disulfide isomerase
MEQSPRIKHKSFRAIFLAIPIVSIALLLLSRTLFSAPQGQASLPVEVQAPVHTSIQDLEGKSIAIPSPDAEVTAIVFLDTECPISNGYIPEINRIYESYKEKGIHFVAAYPDPALKTETAREHGKKYGIKVRSAIDQDQSLAKSCGVTMTPEAVVLLSDGEVVYRGRIDDRYTELGKSQKKVERHDLCEALDDLLNGDLVFMPRTSAVGCYLREIVPPKTEVKQ